MIAIYCIDYINTGPRYHTHSVVQAEVHHSDWAVAEVHCIDLELVGSTLVEAEGDSHCVGQGAVVDLAQTRLAEVQSRDSDAVQMG